MLLSELGADEVAKPRGKTAVVKAILSFSSSRATDAGMERAAAMMSAADEHEVAASLYCAGGRGRDLMAAKEVVAVRGKLSTTGEQTDWTNEFE